MGPDFRSFSSKIVWALAETWVRHIKPVIVPLISWEKGVGWMLVKNGNVEFLQGDPWCTQIRAIAEQDLDSDPGSFLVAWNRDVIICDKTVAGFCKKLAQTSQRISSLPRIFMGVKSRGVDAQSEPKELSMKVTDNVMRVVTGLHASGCSCVCEIKAFDSPETLAVQFLSKEKFAGEVDIQWA